MRPTLHPLAVASVKIQTPGHRPITVTNPRNRPRAGPKSKALCDRIYKPRGPIKRIRRSYSRSRKVEVLMFLTYHRIPANALQSQYQRPTHAQAATYWKIPESTIQEWWKKQDDILTIKKGSYVQSAEGWICAWPEMERELFEDFIKQRQSGRLIRRGWFRQTALVLFKKHYTADPKLFVFSTGWFNGFLRRWCVSCRALTKKASKLPEEYQRLVVNCLRFNRRNSQPYNWFERNQITADIGCFQLSNILNLDETPIPFEYLDGKTYDIKGSKTVGGKTDGSGWDKRQATLILYIFADGISRIKPTLIFHGKTGEAIAKKEGHKWNKNVTVLFNSTAYNNEVIFHEFLQKELIPVLHGSTMHPSSAAATGTSSFLNNAISPSLFTNNLAVANNTSSNNSSLDTCQSSAVHHPSLSSSLPQPNSLPKQHSNHSPLHTTMPSISSISVSPHSSNFTESEREGTCPIPLQAQIPSSYTPYSLLLMDRAAFHVTETILSTLRSNRIIPSIIPGGCTGLLQPLDTAVNKPFKEYLREYTDTYLDEQTTNGHDATKSSVSDKRILTTHVVGRAWHAFCQHKQKLIMKAFRDVGVTLPIDGSRDNEIHIKGFTPAEVALGDWSSDLPTPIAHQPAESFRVLPAETEAHDNLHYVWTCEEYEHSPAETNICPPAGGNILDLTPE